MNFFKKFISFFSPHKSNKEAIEKIIERVRARNSKGHFVADDPNTEKNEAWTEKRKK